jgi:hypothetical protein
MMAQPSRQPVDLQTVTKDVKARVRRVIGELEAIEAADRSDLRLAKGCVARPGARDARA